MVVRPEQLKLAIATVARMSGSLEFFSLPRTRSIMRITFEGRIMKEDSLGTARLVGNMPAGNPFEHWPEFRGFLKLNFNFLQRLASESFKHHGKGLLLLQKRSVENGVFEISYANLEDADFELLSDDERAEFRKCQPPHEFVLCVFDRKGKGYGLRLVNRAIVCQF